MKLKLRTKGKSRFLTPDETEEVIAQLTDNAQEDLKTRAQQTTQFQQLQAAITQTVSSTLTVGSALVSTTLAVAVVTVAIEVTLDPTLPTPVELAVDTVVETVETIVTAPIVEVIQETIHDIKQPPTPSTPDVHPALPSIGTGGGAEPPEFPTLTIDTTQTFPFAASTTAGELVAYLMGQCQ